MKYKYFISFAQNTLETHGTSWRILGFENKPSVDELQLSLEKNNPEFKEISIIYFKLLDGEDVKEEKV